MGRSKQMPMWAALSFFMHETLRFCNFCQTGQLGDKYHLRLVFGTLSVSVRHCRGCVTSILIYLRIIGCYGKAYVTGMPVQTYMGLTSLSQILSV